MKKSKAELLLEKLQEVGEKGMFSFDMIPYGGLRYAARIQDLKNQGVDIESVKEKRGGSVGCRYFLRSV